METELFCDRKENGKCYANEESKEYFSGALETGIHLRFKIQLDRIECEVGIPLHEEIIHANIALSRTK